MWNLRLTKYFIILVTFTYAGALSHFTVIPIERIKTAYNDDEKDRLVPLLYKFKKKKEAEMLHVKNAAALAAAAVLAASSWDKYERAFWLGQLFWTCSLWLSIGAVFSSVSQRLLEQLPETADDAWDDERVRTVLLQLMLKEARPRAAGSSPLPNAEKPMRYCKHPMMIWIWQCPTMLMSYSWLFFVVGYLLVLATPYINGQTGVDRTAAIVGATFGGVVMLNYVMTSVMARPAIKDGESAYFVQHD